MSAPTRKSPILALVLPAIVALLAVAAPGASAASYCVGTVGCSPLNTFPGDVTGLNAAINAANNNATSPGADHVAVGAGEYLVSATNPVSLSAPLTVVGAGVGETVLKADANNITVLQLVGSGTNTLDLSGMTIRNEGFINGYGLRVGVGTAHDLDISVVASGGSVRGVTVNSTGTIQDSSISVTGNGAVAVNMTGASTANRLQIAGTDGLSNGIQSGSTSTRTISESSIRNVKRGIYGDEGPIVVRDVFVNLSAISNAVAVESENHNDCDLCTVSLDASNITVVGSGANQVGVAVGGTAAAGNPANEIGTGIVLNSYFDLTGTGSQAMRCRQSGDNTSASLTSDFVAAKATSINRTGTCSGTDTNLLDTTSLASVYNMASAGDYRPATGSPLIDAGMPGTVIDPGTEDADGLDRIFDGNGDLADRIDIGAYEYQPAMKPTVIFTATPTPVDAGQNVDFNATASDPDGGAVTVSWHFGDFPGGAGTSVSHAYTEAGDFNVVATVTDNEGQSSRASRTVHVNSTPPTTPTAEADLTEAVRGQLITFTASGSNDPDGDSFTYEWTFSGGGSGTGSSVQRAATTVGTFTATVRAVDSNNEESPSDSVSVTINNQTPGVPTISPDVPTAFRGETITFSATTPDPDNDTMGHSWDFGDGTTVPGASAGPQTHAYTTVGVKTITLVVNDGRPAGINTGSTTVEVLDRAPVLGAITRAGGSRIGDIQTFGIAATDADGDPVNFSWNFGDGVTAVGGSATHTYAAAGTYPVSVSGDDGQGAVTVAISSVTIDSPVIKLRKPTKNRKAGKQNPISVNASSATVATVTLAQAGAGWVKGKKCSTKRPATKSKKRCDLPLKKSLKQSLAAGDSKIKFAGRWAGKKLAPGRYRMTVAPDQGGKPVSVLITIL